ncbi:hypothetical protein QJS66_16390 [Kocuria rhizophila]|nr:hypothetical protein QJS66_16390 [Kocuria rhizophila]
MEIPIDTSGDGRHYYAALSRVDGLDYPVVNLYGYMLTVSSR